MASTVAVKNDSFKSHGMFDFQTFPMSLTAFFASPFQNLMLSLGISSHLLLSRLVHKQLPGVAEVVLKWWPQSCYQWGIVLHLCPCCSSSWVCSMVSDSEYISSAKLWSVRAIAGYLLDLLGVVVSPRSASLPWLLLAWHIPALLWIAMVKWSPCRTSAISYSSVSPSGVITPAYGLLYKSGWLELVLVEYHRLLVCSSSCLGR